MYVVHGCVSQMPGLCMRGEGMLGSLHASQGPDAALRNAS